MPSKQTGCPPRWASQTTAVSAARMPGQRSSGAWSWSITAFITVRMSNGCGVGRFFSVIVLADPAIRQGIKDYSNWPTIPQLYVNGEFVGGADIMREMYESGELQQLLAKQAA